MSEGGGDGVRWGVGVGVSCEQKNLSCAVNERQHAVKLRNNAMVCAGSGKHGFRTRTVISLDKRSSRDKITTAAVKTSQNN